MTTNVGKNCYESLCGLSVGDCCLSVKKEVRSNFTGDAAATVGSGRLQAHGGQGTVVSKADSLRHAENPRLLAMDEPQGAAGYCVQSGGTRCTNRIGRCGPSEILKRG